MLGASLGSLQLYFGGPTTANERGGACYSHWNRTSNLHVCNKCCDQMFDSGGLLDFSNLTISSGLHSSTVHYLMSSSVPFLYELWGNPYLKIRLWHLSKLLSPREHTHPPVGRLKRAIDSSKKSQIKTRLQTVGRKKKQLLHKVMSRGLPHESEKLSKELWERKMKFRKKIKSKCVFNPRQHVQQWGSLGP